MWRFGCQFLKLIFRAQGRKEYNIGHLTLVRSQDNGKKDLSMWSIGAAPFARKTTPWQLSIAAAGHETKDQPDQTKEPTSAVGWGASVCSVLQSFVKMIGYR